MKYFTIFLLVVVLILIIAIICINNSKQNKEEENYVVMDKNLDPIYGQYFNPYYMKPTTCMETLFNTVECYKFPSAIWTDDWWMNR